MRSSDGIGIIFQLPASIASRKKLDSRRDGMIPTRRVSQAYPVVLALGCLAGLGWLALRRGVSREADVHAFPAALAALALGLVGARLGFILLHDRYFLGNPLEAAWMWRGGLSWVGAALGALAAIGLYAALRRVRLAPLADALVLPSLAVALAAWTGCLLEDCVYGLPIPPGPLALPAADLFGVVVPRWPTATAGMMAAGLLLCFFLLLDGRTVGHGQRAVGALAGLAAIGLGLSFTRADPALMVGLLRVDALGAALLLLLALSLALFVRREPGRSKP
jgi:phosphatidylglycerol:prolipoprotein diacylglycerol transferase